MTGQQLKNAILALAVQGKLVPQNPQDEPAAALLERVKAEKARLVKAGKIKKEKTLPPITDEEKPFEIPKTWEWIRLGACSTYGQVKRKATDKDKKSKIWSLDLEDIEKDTGHVLIKRQAIDKPIRGEKVKFEKGDVLYSKLRPYLKKILVAEDGGICTTEIVPFKVFGNIDANFLAYVLRSPHIDYEINAASYGAKMPRVGTDTMVHLLIPIPPLAEQKRIVKRIEELLPWVSAYDAAEQKLSRLDTDFPDKLKKSILQQAVQGKLAKQDKNDEPASELLKRIKAEKERLIAEGKIKKEKPLRPIRDEEKPFKIPEGWEWVRLGTLCCKIGSGNTPTGGRSSDVYKTSGVPLLREQNIYADGLRYEGLVYISEELSQTRQGSKVYAKDLLLNITGGSIGRCAIVPNDFHIGDINQHVLIIRLIEPELRGYIHTYICSPLGQSIINTKAVGARAGFSAEKCKNMVVPLPPMEEGKRIVEQKGTFLDLCDKIIKNINNMGEDKNANE